MRNLKRIMAAIVLATGAIASESAFADPIACAGSGTDTGSQNWSYFTGLNAGGGCYQQDKLYSGFSATVLNGSYDTSNLTGQISFLTIGALDLHSVTWQLGSTVAGVEIDIGYTISIYNPSVPRDFGRITLGADVLPSSGAYAELTAAGNGGPYTLRSPSGVYPDLLFTSGNPLSLAITHELDSAAGGISGSTATYVEYVIPEPGSLALFGLGLAGMLASRRRKS